MDIKQDKELVQIQKQAGDVVTRANNFLVASDKKYGDATGVISWLAGMKKKIEERRKFFTQPLNDQVKKINILFKGYSLPLDEARGIVESKMLSYRKVQQEKIDKENERIEKEAAKIAKKEGIPAEEVIQSTEKKELQSTVGTATVKKTWIFEVVDEKKVPREWLEIDNVKVNAAIRAGARKIPGLIIRQKESISTY